MWESVFFWSVAAAWWLLALALTPMLRRPATLPPHDDGGGTNRPHVSVVIAARNEERRIESVVRGLLAQRGVQVEVIVVDDRSDDGTPQILARLAAEDARLRVLRVDRLPPGWLGKPHACDVGAGAATGEWLLFTDADALMADDVVARAVRAAEREGVAHVCLLPRDDARTLWARATLVHFSLGGAFVAAAANRDRRWAVVGVGAFNLVRADLYRDVGGHRRLRMEVIDDVKLGLLLLRAGARTRAYWAAREIEVHWAITVPGLIRAVEKNSFALMRFSLLRVAIALAVTAAAVGATAVTLALGGAAGLAAAAALAWTWLPAGAVSRRMGWGPGPALLAPFTGPILVAAMLNSALATVRAGGIRWRDTFYPLAELRRGIVR